MNENDKYFIRRYEELLDKGYCDCNEMNCIDNNSPRRILNIVNNLQSKIDKAIEYINNEYDTEPKELYGLVSADELLEILKEDKKCQN